jgi:hypothetical protein
VGRRVDPVGRRAGGGRGRRGGDADPRSVDVGCAGAGDRGVGSRCADSGYSFSVHAGIDGIRCPVRARDVGLLIADRGIAGVRR